MKEKETYQFIRKSFENGNVEVNGTEVSTILPSMSRFSKANDRRTKKRRVLNKLLEFFDKFFSITN